jgi:Ca-activated chloride channel family protein
VANGLPGQLVQNRALWEQSRYAKAAKDGKGDRDQLEALKQADERLQTYNLTHENLARRQQLEIQSGKLGVDLAVNVQNLRTQQKLDNSALRNVQGRNLLEFGGVWIDEGYAAKTPTLVVKAQSDAYFRILERHPGIRDVFRLGNHLVWITPSGAALVVDTNDGKEKLGDLGDSEIDKLFVASK